MSRKRLRLKELKSKLSFVELPLMLRKMGEPPDWILSEGYNPDTDSQVAVFGSEADLKAWRDAKVLDISRYPIHSSRMGVHIDVYGKYIKELIPSNDIIGIKIYQRTKK